LIPEVTMFLRGCPGVRGNPVSDTKASMFSRETPNKSVIALS
jgi:hypothetical protein